MGSAETTLTSRTQRVVSLMPFIEGLRKAEQAAIDAENARRDKETALKAAKLKLAKLLKVANQRGKPHELIVSILRTRLGIDNEFEKARSS